MDFNKLLHIYDAVGLPPFLINVNLEPTNACQLKCKTCYRQGRPTGFMSQETFELAAQQIRSIPTLSIIKFFVAGEPLLHPRLYEMVDYFSAIKTKMGKPYWTEISTNGGISFLQYADKLDSINVSLGGLGRKHETNRAGSDWELVQQNILEFAGLTRKRTRLSVSLVQTDETGAELKEFEYYWKDKVDSVNIGRYQTPDLRLVNYGNGNLRSWGKCVFKQHTAGILWNGRVTTCCSDLQGLNVYGNICDTHLKDMPLTPGPLCKTCTIWKAK